MAFKLTIDRTANAAFGESVDETLAEIARILRDTADRLDDGQEHGRLRDINGNTVGEFSYGDDN